MFRSETVFVIGAGASKDYGMPLGTELAKTISRNLSMSSEQAGRHYSDYRAETLIRWRFKENQSDAFEGARLIPKGLTHAQSIDAFIDMHLDKPLISQVGKLQIALSLLRAEAASKLYVDASSARNRINFELPEIARGWLRPFTEMLLEKSRASSLDDIGDGLSIICFNYDRCIEHYLVGALRDTYGITEGQAQEKVGSLNIIHPYGSLGDITSVPFGADPDEGGLNPWKIADSLSTFSEEMSDQVRLKAIRSAIERAGVIVFLGFSFHPQNMTLLTPSSSGRTRVVRAYSTGIGIHQVANNAIEGSVRGLLGSSGSVSNLSIMNDVGCGDLLRFNRQNLTRH